MFNKSFSAFALNSPWAVFVAGVGPNCHLRPKIGGTWEPSLGLMEFPTLYPTIVPKIPVPADWSILPKAIKTVMQTIATRTISAFGGLVMFMLGTLVVRAGQGMFPTIHKGSRNRRNRQVTGHHTQIRQCCFVCMFLFCKLP